MRTISLVLTSPVVRSGLRQFLADIGYSVIGEASDTARGVPGEPHADIVIVDAALCTEDVGVLTSLRQYAGDRVIVLGNRDQLRCLPPALIMAADGVVSLDASCEALHRSLACVEIGERVTPRWLTQTVMMTDMPTPAERMDGAAPSGRQAEILCFLAVGLSNKLIAHQLGIAEATVKVHLKQLFQKLRFTNRTEAALWAQQNLQGQEQPHLQTSGDGAHPSSAVHASPSPARDQSTGEKPTTAEKPTGDVAVSTVPDYGRSRMVPARDRVSVP